MNGMFPNVQLYTLNEAIELFTGKKRIESLCGKVIFTLLSLLQYMIQYISSLFANIVQHNTQKWSNKILWL